jgi:uncharacterized protein YndB with AHSA1/START domain
VGAEPPAAGNVAGTIEVRRTLAANPEEVFRAWTDPEWMGNWMSPVGTATAEVDLRQGGRFRVVMSGRGMVIEHTGEYLHVEPPNRLVFTWQSPFTGDEPSVVTVALSAAPGGTELVLTHGRLPRDVAESHGEGWAAMFDRLATMLQERRT